MSEHLKTAAIEDTDGFWMPFGRFMHDDLDDSTADYFPDFTSWYDDWPEEYPNLVEHELETTYEGDLTADEIWLIEWDEPVHEGPYSFQRNREFRGNFTERLHRKDNRRKFQGPGKKCRRLPWEAWRRKEQRGKEKNQWHWLFTGPYWSSHHYDPLATIEEPVD